MSGSLAETLAGLFGDSSNQTGPLQMSARGVVVLVYGLVMVRLFGRRIFGRWSPLDVVLSVMIGSNLSRTMTGNAPLLSTLAATTALIAIYWGVARVALHSDRFSRVIKGRPVILIEDGTVDWDQMRRQNLGSHDLDEALRSCGCRRVEDVKIARLERNGDISVIA